MMIEHLMIVVLAVMYLKLHLDYKAQRAVSISFAKDIVRIAAGEVVAVRRGDTIKIEEKK